MRARKLLNRRLNHPLMTNVDLILEEELKELGMSRLASASCKRNSRLSRRPDKRRVLACCLRMLFMRVELVNKVGVDAQISDEWMVVGEGEDFLLTLLAEQPTKIFKLVGASFERL